MRKFSSYGPVDKDLHYYVPRTELIQAAHEQLCGPGSAKGGHFITVWAPRQCGKTWLMREVVGKIGKEETFEIGFISMQSAKTETSDKGILAFFSAKMEERFDRNFETVTDWKYLRTLFSAPYFEKPLILVLDEFDSIQEDFINKFANEFRDIYISRRTEPEQESGLHGLALIGVRSVLGIENVSGSPFNVQRSMHVPNLSLAEVRSMFHWYETESGQKIEEAVTDRLFYETRGQPGLISWFGELLTETYNLDPKRTIGLENFEYTFKRAVQALPNNQILNIISKAKQAPYRDTLLSLFKTDKKTEFAFDDPHQNFLYLNGIIDIDDTGNHLYVRFSCPFVQKRLFNYFSGDIFRTVDHLYDPMTDLASVINEDEVHVPELMALYQTYLSQNRDWLLKDAPRRRTDLRIYEAVFHFNLYMYLKAFFQDKGGDVFPEFPTGNGKVDILIRYKKELYALELKSFKDRYAYQQSLVRAAQYAEQLGLKKIYLILFIDTIDDANRRRLETVCRDEKFNTEVVPLFVVTGNEASRELGA